MISELKQVGLNEYEAKVYITLLEEGSLKGGQISKISKVPHGKTYESLVSLESKGFISITPVKPKIFTALNPDIAIDNLLNQKNQTFNNIKDKINEKLKTSKKVKEDKIIEKVQVLSGKKKAFALSKYLYDNSKKIMRHMFTYEIRDYSQHRSMRDAVKRGVEVRVIAAKKTKQGLKWMKEDIKDGIKVRYYSVEELRIDISDINQSMISFLNPKDSRDRVNMFFEHGIFSKMLTKFFDELWEKAEKIN